MSEGIAGSGTAVSHSDNVFFKFAHDVRTYLRTILTRIELVQQSPSAVLHEEDRQMLDEAAVAARGLSDLLSAMVAYSEGKAETGAQPVGLLLRGVVHELHKTLKSCNAEIAFPDSSDVRVPMGLKPVVKELLTNSCRFRAAGRSPNISIEVRPAPEVGQVVVAVSDNGIGVEREFLTRIFDPFFRLHSRDEYPGHGLGLALCAKIVANWAGSISAEPTAGQGLTVLVTVPRM